MTDNLINEEDIPPVIRNLPPKQQYKLVKKEYHRQFKLNPSKFYIPNLKLQQFVRELNEEHEKYNVFILPGGNGCGKTSLFANLVNNIIFGPQSEYFDFPIFKDWKFPKKGRIVGTSANVEGNPEKGEVGAIQAELAKWLYPNHYKTEKMGKSYSSLFKFDNGWSVDVMTYNQDASEFAGPSLGFIGFDEPPPQAIFKECLARLRQGGIIFVTMTALDEAWWIFQEVEAGANFYMHPFVDSHDNCKQCGVDGYLEHHHIEKVLETYVDADEKEARKTGKPMYYTGRKYKLYNPDYHLIGREQAYEMWPDIDYYPMVMACDPHDRRPFVFLWAKILPGNDLVLWNEYPNRLSHPLMYCQIKDSQLTVRDYAKMIFDYEFGTPIVKRLIDAYYVPERVGLNSKSSVIQDFAVFKIIFIRAEASQQRRDAAVREYLNLKPIDQFLHDKRHRIWIVNDLVNMEWSLRNHIWDEGPEDKDLKQKVKDTPAKCFCNCLEYLCAARPDYQRIEPTYSPHPEPKLKPPKEGLMRHGGKSRWVV